jgi:hypothetical protein
VKRNTVALYLLVIGVTASVGCYGIFKSRPGAYQGSPHFFHDPAQQGALYPLDAIPVPASTGSASVTEELQPLLGEILDSYADSLDRILRGYYILDRNYNYAFHNALFLRTTPLLPDFRARGLAEIEAGRETARNAAARWHAVRRRLQPGETEEALVDDVAGFVRYSLQRAAVLEAMSARFERTPAGLQHATHLYEGEGKMLGITLMQLIEKHRGALNDPEIADVTTRFVASGRHVYDSYANRIVGF